MKIVKLLLRWLLGKLYRVRINGFQYYAEAGDRVMIIANHVSFLDAVLLGAFLPGKPTFAVETHIAEAWWIRPVLTLVDFFPMNPRNPLATRALIKYLSENRKAVVFPEGRITVTGALMKIYQGPGLVADKSQAQVLPIRIEGAQYTPFSRLHGVVRLRWFPRITLTLLPPRRIELPPRLRGRARRIEAANVLADIMTEMMFVTGDHRQTLFRALLKARHVYGGRRVIAEDIEGNRVTYNELISRAFILGKIFAQNSAPREVVGLLLPNMVSTLIAFMALQLHGRVPAMLNFTAGVQGIATACKTAGIRVIYSSRRFVETAKLHASIAALSNQVRVIYLEDLRAEVKIFDELMGVLNGYFADSLYRRFNPRVQPEEPAVVLFTSGSEGVPKAVVLSHLNLLANKDQIAARIDFRARDTVLTSLPMFHSFGLNAGTLLPLLCAVKVFFYPSPLHYRNIPEIAYEINATLLFGTNTFLTGYARFANPFDFYSVRYVFAGAEKLQEETRRVWADKFGLRLLEGYGTTETGPVLAVNTPAQFRQGSVGRLLPGIEWYLDPVPGIDEGGRLYVRGPNVMLGYLRNGQITPPSTERGLGWYDTGDVVRIDENGFVWILGRAKRFAKIGGEMVSLATVEELVQRVWPKKHHAVFNFPDARKGEELVLLTEYGEASRQPLLDRAKIEGVSAISVPRKILFAHRLPLLGNGKVDYVAARAIAQEALAGKADATREE